jgi:hypothetical protein
MDAEAAMLVRVVEQVGMLITGFRVPAQADIQIVAVTATKEHQARVAALQVALTTLRLTVLDQAAALDYKVRDLLEQLIILLGQEAVLTGIQVDGETLVVVVSRVCGVKTLGAAPHKVQTILKAATTVVAVVAQALVGQLHQATAALVA